MQAVIQHTQHPLQPASIAQSGLDSIEYRINIRPATVVAMLRTYGQPRPTPNDLLSSTQLHFDLIAAYMYILTPSIITSSSRLSALYGRGL